MFSFFFKTIIYKLKNYFKACPPTGGDGTSPIVLWVHQGLPLHIFGCWWYCYVLPYTGLLGYSFLLSKGLSGCFWSTKNFWTRGVVFLRYRSVPLGLLSSDGCSLWLLMVYLFDNLLPACRQGRYSAFLVLIVWGVFVWCIPAMAISGWLLISMLFLVVLWFFLSW